MSSGIGSETASSPDGVLTGVANDYGRAALRSLNHEHRRRVHTVLHHNHLPTLEGNGMIVHDTDAYRIKSTTGEFGEEVLALVSSYESCE